MTTATLDASFVPAALLDATPLHAADVPADPAPRPSSSLLQGIVVLLAAGLVALAVVPALLGFKGQVVLSGSMAPRLQVGDVSYLKPVPVDALRVGQIVTFPVSNEGRVVQVTHRIVAITGSGPTAVLTTKGDANPAKDAFTTQASQVKGRYAFTVPKLGKLLSVLRDRTNYFLVAGLIFAAVLLHEGRVLTGEYRTWRTGRRVPQTG